MTKCNNKKMEKEIYIKEKVTELLDREFSMELLG